MGGIHEVSDDYSLGTRLQALEAQHRAAARPDTVTEMVSAIRARYDFDDDPTPPAAS